jgi:hypothetical protein
LDSWKRPWNLKFCVIDSIFSPARPVVMFKQLNTQFFVGCSSRQESNQGHRLELYAGIQPSREWIMQLMSIDNRVMVDIVIGNVHLQTEELAKCPDY